MEAREQREQPSLVEAKAGRLAEYAMSYFNTARPHQGVGQQIPVPGEHTAPRLPASIVATPVLGGLHHHYIMAA
jgi:putative transposase